MCDLIKLPEWSLSLDKKIHMLNIGFVKVRSYGETDGMRSCFRNGDKNKFVFVRYDHVAYSTTLLSIILFKAFCASRCPGLKYSNIKCTLSSVPLFSA